MEEGKEGGREGRLGGATNGASEGVRALELGVPSRSCSNHLAFQSEKTVQWSLLLLDVLATPLSRLGGLQTWPRFPGSKLH